MIYLTLTSDRRLIGSEVDDQGSVLVDPDNLARLRESGKEFFRASLADVAVTGVEPRATLAVVKVRDDCDFIPNFLVQIKPFDPVDVRTDFVDLIDGEGVF